MAITEAEAKMAREPLTGRALTTPRMLAAEPENAAPEASMSPPVRMRIYVVVFYAQETLPALLPMPTRLKTATALSRRAELRLAAELETAGGQRSEVSQRTS